MRSIVVSLPVGNLKVSEAFFAGLGFTFSPGGSLPGTACMLVDRNVRVLLVEQERYRDLINGDLSQDGRSGGLVTSLSVGSEQDVDDIVAKAVATGAKPWPILEERTGYSGSFQDLDGHLWQFICEWETGG